MNPAISGEILAKESRFPRSEIFFAILLFTNSWFKFFKSELCDVIDIFVRKNDVENSVISYQAQGLT